MFDFSLSEQPGLTDYFSSLVKVFHWQETLILNGSHLKRFAQYTDEEAFKGEALNDTLGWQAANGVLRNTDDFAFVCIHLQILQLR